MDWIKDMKSNELVYIKNIIGRLCVLNIWRGWLIRNSFPISPSSSKKMFGQSTGDLCSEEPKPITLGAQNKAALSPKYGSTTSFIQTEPHSTQHKPLSSETLQQFENLIS